eukprot:COSAG05_NODE_1195_length_5563_cov_4.163193_8_plen_109_part_00
MIERTITTALFSPVLSIAASEAGAQPSLERGGSTSTILSTGMSPCEAQRSSVVGANPLASALSRGPSVSAVSPWQQAVRCVLAVSLCVHLPQHSRHTDEHQFFTVLES